nr:ORF3 [Torque teno felis virus]
MKNHGGLFFPVNLLNIQSVLYFSCINSVLRLSEMHYGDRCRETSVVMTWFPNPPDQVKQIKLKPDTLLKHVNARKIQQISGEGTSTPTGSSRKRLFKELLEIITTLSDGDWKNKDDLDLSLESLSSSSQSTTSSSQSDFEPISPP